MPDQSEFASKLSCKETNLLVSVTINLFPGERNKFCKLILQNSDMTRLTILFISLFLFACGAPSEENESPRTPMPDNKSQASADPMKNKGIGEIKNVELNDPLDPDMVDKGEAIYQMKCAACHKLTDQRVVGPGWAGVTKKRTPEWIMNMTTNVDIMLAEDPIAQELLKECLVRMPNQNLSVGDARDVLEFMYHNDGMAEAEE